MQWNITQIDKNFNTYTIQQLNTKDAVVCNIYEADKDLTTVMEPYTISSPRPEQFSWTILPVNDANGDDTA